MEKNGFILTRTPRDIAQDILCMIIGSAAVGGSVSVFTAPNDIAPGGVSGLSTALASITPISVSVLMLLINIPLLVFGIITLGVRASSYTCASTVLVSVFAELADRFLPQYKGDMMLATLMGGVIMGFGIGLLFLRGISSGGTDLLALILKKKLPNIPSGVLLMVLDVLVVIVAVIIFKNVDIAIYSGITIVVSSKIIDVITMGADHAKVIYIVTEEADNLVEVLHTNTDRGTTIVPAVGGFTGDKKQMVMTVTRRNVLAETLRLIKQTDPKAFTFVVDSTEVHGEGFKV